MGEIHHRIDEIRLVRWQQPVEWRMTGINFAEISGQPRPDEDMLREEDGHKIIVPWVSVIDTVSLLL